MSTVLVIEDNVELREEIADILRFEGYVVQQASNGKEGMEIACSSNNDIILCDLMMPEMDGFEVLRTLKTKIETALVPVIVLTALSERKNMRYAMEIGACDYLIKPFTQKELLNTVKSQLIKVDLYNQQVKKMQDRIFYSIPHELKTPLNAISVYGSLIRDSELPSEELKKVGDSIVGSAEQLNSIIQKYLLYINLDLSKQEFSLTPIIITQEYFISFAARTSKIHQRESDLEMSTLPFRTQLSLKQDLFFFAFQEILDNAFKFSEYGQKVIVRFHCSDTFLKISIQDFGKGFPEGKANSIHAFTQFDRENYEQKGIGLGLFLAKKIIELHLGNIKINSVPNKETSVEIILPVTKDMIN